MIPDIANLQTTPHFLPLFDESHPEAKKMFKVWRSGRGAGKSTEIATALPLKGVRSRRKILCGREFQNSIADSVMSLLKKQIEASHLDKFYRATETAIIGANKTEFLFKGLKQNINSVKSLDGIDTCWLEEAQAISKNSMDILFPTIRADGAEFIISYNPEDDDTPIHEFVNSLPKELVYLCELNWSDNPWFPETLRVQKDLALRRIDEADSDDERAILQADYDHIWGGQTRKNARSQIFAGKTVVREFEAIKGDDGKWRIDGIIADGPYYGVDWGFAVDPTAALKVWIAGENIYIEHELYKHQLEIDETPEALRTIPGLSEHTVRADNARPETISHCRKTRKDKDGKDVPGLSIVAVEKWPDSVEDGITVLRGFKKIFIHKRCVNMQTEARLYSYKVDAKTGDVLAEIVDKFNHLWDALRYALAPFIKRSGKGLGFLEAFQNQQRAKEAAKNEVQISR